MKKSINTIVKTISTGKKVVEKINDLTKQSKSKKDMKNIEDLRDESAELIIRNHMVWSMGAGFIPIPFMDFAAVTYIQLDMIKQLAKLYDIDYKETKGKAVISSLTTAGLAKAGASRAIKFVPIIGSYLGGIATAVFSGSSTYAVGQVFKKHFDNGGTFLDIDLNALKKMYDDKFEKGKEIAENFSKEQKNKEDLLKKAESINLESETSTLITRLKELADMKNNGIISEEEFNILKTKLIK